MDRTKTEWQEFTLKELCEDVRYGYTASANENDIGPKFLRITDIVPDFIDWSSVPHCEIEQKNLNKYLLKEGDIVVARTGATTGYAKRIKNPPKSVFASYLVRLKIKNGFDDEFIGYIVQSEIYKEFIKKNWGGSAQPNANAQIITSFPLKVPDLETQQKIASILSAFDDLIENNTRRIAILEEMARLIYREWFVHYRYPGHENDKMVDSGTEFGEVPEGWEVKKLEDVADLNPENISTDYEGEIEYINISGVDKGQINETEIYEIEDAPGRAKRKVKGGDIIWSSVRPNLKAYALIINPAPNWIASTGFAVIRPVELPASFLYNFSTTDFFVDYLVNHTRGSAYPAVNVSDFKNAKLIVPPMKLVESFDEITWSKYQQIDKMKRKNKILKETRDLLLPKLISGKIQITENQEIWN